jgi:hypothetical protein
MFHVPEFTPEFIFDDFFGVLFEMIKGGVLVIEVTELLLE